MGSEIQKEEPSLKVKLQDRPGRDMKNKTKEELQGQQIFDHNIITVIAK